MSTKQADQIQYHILNGDALKDQFPAKLQGTIIVARECLIVGNLQGDDLAQFFENRAEFIHQSYPEHSVASYYKNVATEFQAILDIPDDADINLWFEDDLFCQTNLWFVISLLSRSDKKQSIYLVRPKTHSKYGFGKYDEDGLSQLYNNRIRLTDMEKIAMLWSAYKEGNNEQFIDLAQGFKKQYPFITTSAEAHLARMPNEHSLGLPKETLVEIMKELDTTDFALIFQEFNERLPIYGFGDSQVFHLLKELNASTHQ